MEVTSGAEVSSGMEVTSELEMSALTTLKEGVRIGLGSINANRVRSGLTILGVAIGVGVVVMLAALITGIRTSVMEGFQQAGPDNFGIIIAAQLAITEIVGEDENDIGTIGSIGAV